MTDLQHATTEGRPIPNQPTTEHPPDPQPPVDTHTQNGHQPRRATPAATPPHDLDAERNLLGAILLGNHQALTLIDDQAFYAPGHAHIANALRTLIADDRPVDPVTLADELRTRGLLEQAGGTPTLATLLYDAPAAAAGPAYAHIINRHHRARTLEAAGHNIAITARRDGPDAAYELLRPLLDHHSATGPTLHWEDVSPVVRGDYQPLLPTMLTRTDGQSLIYPGMLHWLMGEPGKGKSWVAVHLAAEQLRQDRHVIYLDWEGNRQTIGSRLANLGVPADQAEACFHYLRPPAITRPIASAIAALAADTHTTITICDGVAKALARNDLNEDKAPDVLAWLELLTTPICDAGSAVLCLDHVAKDRENRGSWARGSGAKIGEVSGASWKVKPKIAFSRHQAGEIDLIQTKDREGHVGVDGQTVARVRISPSTGGENVQITLEPPQGSGTAFRPTRLMQTISMALERFNNAGDEPTGRDLLREIPGKREHQTIALQRLVEEGFVTTRPGTRRAIHHISNRPYLELDDPESDTYRPSDPTPDHEDF